MRTLAIISLAILTIAISCTRSKTRPDGPPTAISGKWKYVEYWQDIGNGLGNLRPAPPNETYIDFKLNYSLESDIEGFKQFHSYELKNDTTITFYSKNNPPMTMACHIGDASLELLPPCFEGCGFRFKK